jgi:hypothetical protein
VTFYVELPPITDRIQGDAAMRTLEEIAKCYERHVVSSSPTLQRKLDISEGLLRNALNALINAEFIEVCRSPYTDGAGGEDGRYGFKVLQKGWDRLGYKPLWIK